MEREATKSSENYMIDDRVILISDINKYVNITDDLTIQYEDVLKDSIDAFKSNLESTINKLYEEIDFLKSEIEEKNLMIRALIFKDANDGEKVDRSIVEDTPMINNSTSITTPISENSTHSDTIHGLDHLNVKHINLSTNTNDYDDYIDINNEVFNSTDLLNQKDPLTSHTSSLFLNDSFNLNESFIDSATDYNSIESQIRCYKIDKHNKYMHEKNNIEKHLNENRSITITDNNILCEVVNTPVVNNAEFNNKRIWPADTILITGDSILNNIEESRLKKKFNVKIRAFSGANVRDMYDYLAPLLRKKPDHIIIHTGSNDAPDKNSDEILEEISNLKLHIESILPNVKVYLSCPLYRFDNVKAGMTLMSLKHKMKDFFTDTISNDNVDNSCIGRKGLHPNSKGTGRLAMNFISLMRHL